MNRFVIVVPVYNGEKWIARCLDSIVCQDYSNYDVIVINDHSTDGTRDVVKSYNVNSFTNKERNGSGLANIIKGINWMAQEQDIIVTVDGDDYLSNNKVLSYLNGVYNDQVWLTYGSYLPLSGRYSGTNQDLSNTFTVDESGKWVTNHLTPATYRRSGVWVTTHLRTFRKWLWDKIKNEDLRDESGYYKLAWDMAFMYPMIEMAGRHIRFIEEILYIYNDLNPDCDGTREPGNQIAVGKLIQGKPNYKEL